MAGRVIPEPYVYPDTPHVRRHGPRGFNDYKRYRPWLRDEFSFRCVYCLEREVWRDMRDRMHIDHFVSQAIRKDLKCDYSNLLYACPGCNKLKGTKLLPDPCQLAFGKYLRIPPPLPPLPSVQNSPPFFASFVYFAVKKSPFHSGLPPCLCVS